jgi:cyclopropane-fatty-acyl-phospholipid synthase
MVSEKGEAMRFAIELAERGLLPDSLIRWGIRQLDKKRLRLEDLGDREKQRQALERFVEELRNSPVAVQIHKPKEQHYELPPAFFENVLGKWMKYSSCYWPQRVDSLDEAEEAMLELTCERAQLEDGMEILELGSGWGSLSRWMAEQYPNSRIVTVSNSRPQGEFIKARCAALKLDNVEVISADMNNFHIDQSFHRVVSVEMFEHMRNWGKLLARIATWLKPGGKLFLHIFTHRKFAYLFEDEGDDNWLGRNFFTAGLMPSHDLLLHFQKELIVEDDWRLNGVHYKKTADVWLNNLDKRRQQILPIVAETYGQGQAERWLQRWRIFFLACSELWGYGNGEEWLVSHYRLKKKTS